MNTLTSNANFILMLFALICFMLGTIRRATSPHVDWTAMGLAFWAFAIIVSSKG